MKSIFAAMLKAARTLNFISLILFAGTLIIVYAYLPIQVSFQIEEMEAIHKDRFFYYTLGLFVVINLLSRMVKLVLSRKFSGLLLAWAEALSFVCNIYLALIVGFIGVLNNSTHISPDNYAYLNLLGPILLIVWAGGLIFLALNRKAKTIS